ncbi:hypothetical protein P8625_04 [Verrucomicrobia phage P8625]|uniref:hypothetical protein n=1 Tax=Verrucomicrobia phage P8625 TaxID=1636271 RepID=UPI0005FEB351|nr:hypothetical protein AWI59_gp04 [Verrucomicrobia phage P8625]AKA60255.1 hypothetical protein P8625_04 [Verrucomicrobia phage P8625]
MAKKKTAPAQPSAKELIRKRQFANVVANVREGKSKSRASSETSDTADFQSDNAGATPTDALHIK